MVGRNVSNMNLPQALDYQDYTKNNFTSEWCCFYNFIACVTCWSMDLSIGSNVFALYKYVVGLACFLCEQTRNTRQIGSTVPSYVTGFT